MSVEETSVKLFGDQAAEAPAAEAPNVETPAPEPAETQASPPAPVVAAPMVPLNMALDERDKRQAAERRAQEAEARWQAEERRREELRAQAPNVLEDPEGYHAWVQDRFGELNKGFESRLERAVITERLANSEEKWRDKLGDEKFEAFHAWTATQHPQWVAQAERQRDPFGFAYKEFDKIQKAQRAEQILGKLGDKDLDAFLEEQKQAWIAENAPPADVPPLTPERARAPDGKFTASPSQQQRPASAPSLNSVNGAPAPRGTEQRSGYEALFQNK